MELTFRQRLSWYAHLGKALLQQHHREDLPYLKKLIPEDGVVFDIGAHSGQYTKLFAGIARKGRVYAFEPSEYARSILERLLRWRKLPNVTLLALALSDTKGVAQLATPIKKSGSLGFGLAHLVNAALSTGKDLATGKNLAFTVETSTVDQMAESLGLRRLDFIKADIEGFELHMLRGARQTLQRFKPILQLEISEPRLARAGSSAAELRSFLKSLGYSEAASPNGDAIFTAR
jgi:FkbM family methyltransferase